MLNVSYSKKYFKFINSELSKLDMKLFNSLINYFKKIKKNKKKIILIGNGGSAAMSSHVSVDLTKQCGIRAINFNEADLITCFANDYGHNNWMKEAINKYWNDEKDVSINKNTSLSLNIKPYH